MAAVTHALLSPGEAVLVCDFSGINQTQGGFAPQRHHFFLVLAKLVNLGP